MRTSALAITALLALLIGCPPDDTRISLDDLARMETEQAQPSEPVQMNMASNAFSGNQRYRAQQGDVLLLTFIGLQTDPTDAGNFSLDPTEIRARVQPNGNVRLPLIGELHVAGKDLATIEQAIITAYVPDMVRDLSVHATAAETGQTTVLVQGAVGRSGLVTLRNDRRNVLYALASANGFGPASSGVVTVQPAQTGRETQRYDLNDINDLRRALTSGPLESGDLLTVETAAAPAIYTTGLLNTPGPIVISRGTKLTVMQAVAASAGLVDFLAPEEATLWRNMPNGESVRVKIPLKDILDGNAPDVALAAGDILDVPHTAATRIRQWALENIRLGPFGMTAVYDPVADRRARIVADDGNFAQSLFLSGFNAAIPAIINPTPP